MAHFSAQARNLIKSTLKTILVFSQKKVFLIFRELELSSPKIKKCLVLYSQPQNFTLKKIYIFLQKKSTLKKFVIFREMELSSPKKLNKTFL